VTVSVRWIPLVTAAYGTRVARPTRTTGLARGGDGSQLDRRVRSVLGDRRRLVGKSRRARGSRVGRVELPYLVIRAHWPYAPAMAESGR
jgi:hypothetical protein